MAFIQAGDSEARKRALLQNQMMNEAVSGIQNAIGDYAKYDLDRRKAALLAEKEQQDRIDKANAAEALANEKYNAEQRRLEHQTELQNQKMDFEKRQQEQQQKFTAQQNELNRKAGLQKTNVMAGVSAQKSEASKEEASNKIISDLRKEVESGQTTKDFNEVRNAYSKVEDAYNNPNPVKDVSMVYNVIKVFDPGSAVKEGEIALAGSAKGVPETIMNAYNKIVKGERLTPTQRREYLNVANQALSVHRNSYEQNIAPKKAFAQARNLPQEQIFPNYPVPTPVPNGQPNQGLTRAEKIKALEGLGYGRPQ